MEESKYYTPEIEEFHFGFEYEFITTKGEFKKYVTNYTSIEEIVAVINHSEDFSKVCRVKYLDKENIEELGWKQSFTNESYHIENNVNDTFQMYLNDWLNIGYWFIQIYNDASDFIFQGNIKNKSELKKLMKQLEII